jgi:uncharacterized membrane-anchored protein YitT (DUF2179 family)
VLTATGGIRKERGSADGTCVFTWWLQDWLKTQPLGVRLFFNGLVVAVSVWLAFATGKFVFMVIGLVIAVFTFNRDDLRRGRKWVNRG